MENILSLNSITKIYDGGVLANHNISFSVNAGEIHALVGENGAGKSTLMKILFGMESATSGTIELRGKEVKFTSSRDAIEHGIGMVHQHFMLVDDFTAAENLSLGIKTDRLFTDKLKEAKATREISARYNLNIAPGTIVRDMSVGMKQKLEILKILYRQADIIILDEPTAVLTPQETDELFDRLIELKQHGKTIIFISHRLKEVKQISDRVTVLKLGKTVGTYKTSDISTDEISNLMVGKVVSVDYKKKNVSPGKVLLKVSGLKYVDQFGVVKLNNVSLEVKDSEVVGIAGVEGNGQSELVGIITTELQCQSGKVEYKNQDYTDKSIGEIRKAGMSYVPEDRMLSGCAASMSIFENMIASNVDSYTNKALIINRKRAQKDCLDLIKKFNVKTNSENRTVKSLSGGNIQKTIVAREFSAGSDMLLLDQPTRGIDVGAINFIHHKILEMRENGVGILLISADLNELISLSDRILVMYKGSIVANLDNKEKISEQELGQYMLGLKIQEALVYGSDSPGWKE